MRTRIILVAVLVGFVFIGIRFARSFAERDNDGRYPDDVVRAFIDAVQRDDYALALQSWRGGDQKAIEQNWRMSFPEFCRQNFKVDNYEVKFGGIDRGSYVFFFRGSEQGKSKTFQLYVYRVDGRWRLVMEFFLKPEGRT